MLALINAAGFDAKPQRVTVTASDKAAVAQVVRSSWKVFLDWKP